MKIEKVEKIVGNLNDKSKYDIHIRNLKNTVSNGLFLRLVHTVIKFNQKAWLEPYMKMKTELKQKPKNNFEKDFFKLMNNEQSFCISNIEYDPLGNSNSSFDILTDILNLLFLYDFFILFHV